MEQGGNRFRESAKPGVNALDRPVDSRNQHLAPPTCITPIGGVA